MRQSRRRQQAGPEQPASWLPCSCHAVMPTASWDLAASELASEIPRAVCLFVLFFFYAARSCRRLSLRFASLRFFLSRRCFSRRPSRVFGASSYFLLLLGSLMCCAACNSEARRCTVPPSRSTRRLLELAPGSDAVRASHPGGSVLLLADSAAAAAAAAASGSSKSGISTGPSPGARPSTTVLAGLGLDSKQRVACDPCGPWSSSVASQLNSVAAWRREA